VPPILHSLLRIAQKTSLGAILGAGCGGILLYLLKTHFPQGYKLEPTWAQIGATGLLLAGTVVGFAAATFSTTKPISLTAHIFNWILNVPTIAAAILLGAATTLFAIIHTKACQTVSRPNSSEIRETLVLSPERAEALGINTPPGTVNIISLELLSHTPKDTCLITVKRYEELKAKHALH
jgi:hypothetical protein